MKRILEAVGMGFVAACVAFSLVFLALVVISGLITIFSIIHMYAGIYPAVFFAVTVVFSLVAYFNPESMPPGRES